MKKLLLLCLLPLAAWAVPDPLPEPLAPGVFLLRGAADPASPVNGGFTANGGFFVGDRGVVLLNPGPNRAAAQARQRAVGQLTPLPVTLVIDAHARPEQVLGTGWFVEQGVPVLAHAETARLMKARCERCLELLSAQVGAAAMAGTRIVLPQPGLADGQGLGLSGRRLRIIVPAGAMLPGNTAIFDEASGILFAGVLVSLDRIPDLRDADPAGLLEALDRLKALPLTLLVPDQGAPAAPSRLAEYRRYISQLQEKVAAAYRSGVSLAEADAACELPEFAVWSDYVIQHPINVRAWFQRLEKADFEGR